MIYELKTPALATPLFKDWDESMIWSCLQGVMGKIYVTNPQEPKSAMAVLADFAFLAGEPDPELTAYMPENFLIIVPQNETLKNDLIAHHGKRARVITRYAIKKEPDVFDIPKLESYVSSLPEGYTLSMIDESLYSKCKAEKWCYDLVSTFCDYDDYHRLGLGVAVLKDGKIISGASSYARYREGIEVQINTHKEYRHQGLATICGAKLILECLKRGLYPCWDAANLWSVALAEKLGYHYDHPYTTVIVAQK